VNRTAGKSHTVFERFSLHVQTGKRRQQCRVNIHDAISIGFDEYRRQQPHKTRQHDELDTPRPQDLHHLLIVGFAVRKGFMIQDCRKKIVLLSSDQTVSVRFVAKDNLDLSIERLRFDRIDNRLEIGAGAGDENAYRKLPCHKVSLNDLYAARTSEDLADYKVLFPALRERTRSSIHILFTNH
jgi:hypothetical protein